MSVSLHLYLKKTPSEKGSINFSSTQMKMLVLNKSNIQLMEMEIGRTAPNHLGTARVHDSLFCN